jgi:hypothetical protein
MSDKFAKGGEFAGISAINMEPIPDKSKEDYRIGFSAGAGLG